MSLGGGFASWEWSAASVFRVAAGVRSWMREAKAMDMVKPQSSISKNKLQHRRIAKTGITMAGRDIPNPPPREKAPMHL